MANLKTCNGVSEVAKQTANSLKMKTVLIFAILFALFLATKAQRCQDRHDNCYYWYLLGYCYNPEHARTMLLVCPHSCSTCGPRGSGNSRVAGSRRNVLVTTCTDRESNCDVYKNAGYCDRYRDWMTRNCRFSCGLCPTQAPPAAACNDANSYCSTWKKYCDRNSVYWPFMSKNCKKTCGLCSGGGGGGGGGGSGGSNGKREFECGFESDFCDWANQPIDDAADWAIGVASGGPSSGANGSAKYAYVDSTTNRYNAKLILPWELVLPVDKSYIGAMCLHLRFQTGDGSLKIIEDIYPTATNKNQASNVKATLQGSGTWVNGKVLVQVDDKRQLSIEGIVGSSGRVAIDDVAFVKGNC